MCFMKQLAIAALFFCATFLKGQTGLFFPGIQGKTLDDKEAHIPFNNGKYSVVAIAYDRAAETDLKKWLNPLYSMFIKKGPKTNMDMAELYDVNFVFIPVISGFKRIAEDFKKGTDKEFWPYIMDTEKTDIKDLREKLKVTDSKIPYFYVLDKSGKIVEMQSGSYEEEKIDKLEDAID